MSTRTGGYTLKRQMAGRGAFARIAITVEQREPPLAIEICCDSLDEAAIAFGIRYAHGRSLIHVPDLNLYNYVRVVSADYMLADTTDMMVMFASAMAFFDAFGVDGAQYIQLDTATRRAAFSL